MRLAWFTPWPPERSGIAGRSVDVTRVLADRGWAIDVFVDRRRVPATRAGDDPPAPGEVRVQSAHEFLWRQHRGQFDLVVYQMGNSTAHAFIWPYLTACPGLTILHDAHLHHSRGADLITPASADAYRRAFAFDHPEASPDLAELAIAGFDGEYHYLWPMVRSAVVASRAVGVHTRGGARQLQAEYPDRTIEYVALGMGREVPCTEAERVDIRERLAIPADALLLGVFGGLTADKCVPEVLDAFARLRRLTPRAHLLLGGAPDPRLELADRIAALNLGPHVTIADALSDDEFECAIAAIDISVNLRWPTARETSGPWLQALAAGRPTVVLDLQQHVDVPSLDPQTWLPRPGRLRDEPVTVAIDILDQQHSLDLSLTRLATDPALRDRLGRAARAWWEREHTVSRMADDYQRLAVRAAAVPAPVWTGPAEARPDPLAHTHDLVRPFGDLTCALF